MFIVSKVRMNDQQQSFRPLGNSIIDYFLVDHAFSFAGPHAWNNLPDELRRITNTTTFKKHLKTHFLIMLLTSFAFR